MKHLFAAIVATVAFAAAAEDAATIITANAALKDGSTVKGELATKSIKGSTVFMEKLELDPTLVKAVSFVGTNGESKIELKNGDRFAMTVDNESFKINSLLGKLEIPRASFRSLAFSNRKISAVGSDDGLVFYCTFDDEAALAAPVVGPAVKLELGELKADAKKSGRSLFVKPGIAGAEIAFPAGTFGEEGCIEFWANMASDKTEFSTGGDPRFLYFSVNGSERGCFQYASNDGRGNSGICGTFFGIHTYSKPGYSYLMPYSDIFMGEDYNGWHHYALVWTPTTLSIYIDGRKICKTEGKINIEQDCNTMAV